MKKTYHMQLFSLRFFFACFIQKKNSGQTGNDQTVNLITNGLWSWGLGLDPYPIFKHSLIAHPHKRDKIVRFLLLRLFSTLATLALRLLIVLLITMKEFSWRSFMSIRSNRRLKSGKSSSRLVYEAREEKTLMSRLLMTT